MTRFFHALILSFALMFPAKSSVGATLNLQVSVLGSIGAPFYTNNWGFAQGVATDGTNVYHFYTTNLSMQSMNSLTNFSPRTRYNLSPFAELTNAYTHLGAGCYFGGNLYVAAEMYAGCGNVSNASIEVFDGYSLAYKSITVVSNYQGEISAVAASPGGTLYATDFCDGSKIFMYDTNINYLGAIVLSANIPQIQGITWYNGMLLVMADYGDSGNLWVVDPSNGNCSLLATLTAPGNHEWEGIAVLNGTLLACEAYAANLYYYPINLTLMKSQFSLAQAPGTGQMFQVQYKTNLTSTNWINLGSPVAAVGNNVSINNFSGDQQRFYRVQLVPQ